MNAEQYMQDRVDSQIRWLSDRSGSNQRWFRRLRLAEICLAASVPVLVAYADDSAPIKFAVGLAGGFLVTSWVANQTLPETLPDLGLTVTIAPSSLVIAAAVYWLPTPRADERRAATPDRHHTAEQAVLTPDS